MHVYTASTSMTDSCLANADGDLLIVPQQGADHQMPTDPAPCSDQATCLATAYGSLHGSQSKQLNTVRLPSTRGAKFRVPERTGRPDPWHNWMAQ